MVQVLLFKKILQLLLICFMGFAVVRLKVLKTDDSVPLSLVNLYIIFPCSIINSFQIEYSREVASNLVFAVTAALIIHIMLFILVEVPGSRAGLDAVEKTSIMYSNAANLIIPIVTYVLGAEWVLYTMPFIAVQQFFLWTHCVSRFTGGLQLKKILHNINLICIIIGALMLLAGLRLPELITGALSSVSDMMGPLSMVIIGMIAAGTNLKKAFGRKRVYVISAIRLIAVPLILVAALKALMRYGIVEDKSYVLLVVFLAAITPPAATLSQFALLYGGDAEHASSINLVSTLCCAFTMPVMVMLYML